MKHLTLNETTHVNGGSWLAFAPLALSVSKELFYHYILSIHNDRAHANVAAVAITSALGAVCAYAMNVDIDLGAQVMGTTLGMGSNLAETLQAMNAVQ